jgi:hypothetical protein
VIVFYAFDLLHPDGRDFTQRTLLSRKAQLKRILGMCAVKRRWIISFTVSRFSRFVESYIRSDPTNRILKFEEEIQSHLDMQIEDNTRLGMSRDEARYAALRSFGGVDQIKEAYRDRRSLPVVETTLQDLRYAIRVVFVPFTGKHRCTLVSAKS